MPNYLFDVMLKASLRFDAPDEATARQWLRDLQECTANFGAFPNGEPVVGEASIDGPLDLVEVDGDTQEGSPLFHGAYEREKVLTRLLETFTCVKGLCMQNIACRWCLRCRQHCECA